MAIGFPKKKKSEGLILKSVHTVIIFSHYPLTVRVQYVLLMYLGPNVGQDKFLVRVSQRFYLIQR